MTQAEVTSPHNYSFAGFEPEIPLSTPMCVTPFKTDVQQRRRVSFQN